MSNDRDSWGVFPIGFRRLRGSYACGCYHSATTRAVKAVHDALVAHPEPLPVGVHRELDRGMPELALGSRPSGGAGRRKCVSGSAG